MPRARTVRWPCAVAFAAAGIVSTIIGAAVGKAVDGQKLLALFGLYLVMEGGKAMRYGVGVGKAGMEFTGTANVGYKRQWPRWTPTGDMIKRDPDHYQQWAAGMDGGSGNPLGARALYLFKDGKDTLYRIHGTTEPESIGKAMSSGRIRMLNQDVIDLYGRVPSGSRVVVL